MQLRPSPVLPPLPPHEYIELKASIARDGVKVPLLVTSEHVIIDGHERYRAVLELGLRRFPVRVIGSLGEQERVRWAVECNALRRHLSAAERRRLLESYLATNPNKSTREVADLLRVHHSTVADTRNRLVGKPTRPNHKPAYSAETSVQAKEAARLLTELGDSAPAGGASLRKLRRTAYRVRAETEAGKPAGRLPPTVQVVHADFRDVELRVGDMTGRVALAILDPPWSLTWARDNLDDLATMTSRILKQGGICTCYVGQGSLPAFLASFSPVLNYRWLLAARNGNILNGRKAGCVKNMFRCVLVFSKGEFRPPHDIVDLLELDKKDSRHQHPFNWQQPPEEYEFLVKRLSRPGDLIWDGTCGSGGAGEAVVRLGGGRRAILCDNDETCVKLACRRVAQVDEDSRKAVRVLSGGRAALP